MKTFQELISISRIIIIILTFFFSIYLIISILLISSDKLTDLTAAIYLLLHEKMLPINRQPEVSSSDV